MPFAGGARAPFRIRMGGMIGNWSHFNDPINSVHRPSQMGPFWLQAKHITGMRLEPNIWMVDPPLLVLALP